VDVFLGVPGTSVNTKVASSTYSGFGSWGSCHIGNNGNVAQPQGFAGRIDDVQVWDRALTDTEMLEGETPGEEPTEEPLALVSCEIGAVANDLLVCALTDPIDAAFCIPSNFEVTYDLVEQVILNASTTGNFDLCSLTLQNPPESDDVSVFVTYLPEDDGVTATNTVSFPSGPGDGLAQSAHRCLEADRALGIRKLPSCATPSPGAVNVITNVVNTVGSQKAAQRFDLWDNWVMRRSALRGLSVIPAHKDSLERVRQFDRPVLIMTGANTVSFHRRINEILAQTFPSAERAELAGGHTTPVSAVEEFVTTVQAFLTRHRER
jgi:hypothetical protein